MKRMGLVGFLLHICSIVISVDMVSHSSGGLVDPTISSDVEFLVEQGATVAEW